MDVEAVKEFITRQGWTPRIVPRGNGTMYLYAARKEHKKVLWRYICTERKIPTLTPEHILARLENC